MEKIKNHFVPRMYLKNWSHNNKLCEYLLLVSHDKIPVWKEKSIKRIAYIDNWYTNVEDNNSYTLEKMFDRVYENPTEPIFNKIINEERLISNDWKIIVNYIIAQYVRTPSFYIYVKNMMLSILPEELDNMANDFSDKGVAILKRTNDSDITTKALPISIENTHLKPDEHHTLFKFETIIGKSYWFYAIRYLLNERSEVYKYFHKLKWSIVSLDKKNQIPTSDNPIVIVNDLFDKSYRLVNQLTEGLSGNNKYVLFPVTPKKVLIGCEKRTIDWRINADENLAKKIKEVIVKNAFLSVYSISADDEIPVIKKRIVNEKEYNRIKQEINSLHEKYINEEASMLINFDLKGNDNHEKKIQ